jgi:hypothetical protein
MKRWRRSVCRLVAGEVASVDLAGGAGAEGALVVARAVVARAVVARAVVARAVVDRVVVGPVVLPVARVGLLVVPVVLVAG